MWGNKLGWLISAAILLVMLAIIALAYISSAKVTPPTQFTEDPARLAAISLPFEPRSLVPEGLETTDAGPQYAAAIADYRSNLESYERIIQTFHLDRALALQGVQQVLAAGSSAKAQLFADQLDLAVGYGTRPGIDALHKVGGIVGRIATEYARRKQFDEAREYANAQFMLGLHLYEQRLSRPQLSAGLGLMGHAATLRKQIATATENSADALRFGEFTTAYQQYHREQIEPMERVISSIDPNVQSRHIGDVFVIARDSQERVWRIEGALKLGMYKFFHNTPGDRRAAVRQLQRLQMDPDPAIALAAKEAAELTIESYRTLGSR